MFKFVEWKEGLTLMGVRISSDNGHTIRPTSTMVIDITSPLRFEDLHVSFGSSYRLVLHKIIHQYVWYEIKIQYWHLHRRFAIIPSPSMYNIIGRIQPTLQLHNIHICYTSIVLELGINE